MRIRRVELRSFAISSGEVEGKYPAAGLDARQKCPIGLSCGIYDTTSNTICCLEPVYCCTALFTFGHEGMLVGRIHMYTVSGTLRDDIISSTL